jgi:1-acyl-sn-glycerol-3-phosphate acyltransferase
LLGLPWFVALTACQVFYAVTRNRIDPQRRVVNFITQIWGVTLMKLTRATPVMKNGHILQEFYRQKRPAMFVANHNSWMDIPFLGWSIGWRNYKLVSKKELGRVPILGKAIKVGGHIMVDRSDRKSQLKTLKRGIQYLKVRSNEGVRVRSNVCVIMCFSLYLILSLCNTTMIDKNNAGWGPPVHVPRGDPLPEREAG